MFDDVVLVETAAKAAGVDARLLSKAELFASAAAIRESRTLMEAADAHVLAEIDARDAADVEFG